MQARSVRPLVGYAAVLAACTPPPATAAPRAATAEAPPPSAAAAASSATSPPPVNCEQGDGEPEPDDVEIIQPDKPVPDFHVATTSCETLHASEVIGEKPLVIVFFSSWCGVCEQKMPMIREAMAEIGDDARFIGVALDDADTWQRVLPFMQRHDVSMPLVRGDLFQRFSLGFNPFRSIPVVLVVGRDGHLIDLQLGFSPFDKNRLLGAVLIGRGRTPARALPTSPADPAPVPQASTADLQVGSTHQPDGVPQ